LINEEVDNDEEVEDDDDDEEVDDDGDDEDDEEIEVNDDDLNDADLDNEEYDERDFTQNKDENISVCSAENDDSEELNEDSPQQRQIKFNVKSKFNKGNNNNHNSDEITNEEDGLIYGDVSVNRRKNLRLDIDEENGELLRGERNLTNFIYVHEE